MSETGFFISHCESCGGGIEFPASGIGEEIQCPHCQQPITLTFPPVSESNPTEQLGVYLAASVFPKNRDELHLLSKFSCLIEMEDSSQLEYWQTIINNPLEIIQQFLSEGFIQEASPDTSELLQRLNSAAQLKDLAGARGLSQSGTKNTLAERLFKSDPVGMIELVSGRKFLTCSPKGRILADKFRESEKYAENLDQKLCYDALLELRFEDARFLAKNYFSTGGLPAPAKTKSSDDESRKQQWFTAKGALPVGTNIEEYEAEQAKVACLNFLNLIFTTKLLRQARFNQETMRAIQIAAAMTSLFGTGKPPRWMMDNYRDAGFDLEFEARMLEFTASHIVQIQRYKEEGCATVKIIGQDDPEMCQVCRSDNGKIYSVDSCPILPHENCTCDGGCPCYCENSELEEKITAEDLL